MFDLSKLYDYLKQDATKIHFFGLGFIQVKVGKKERYHFYNPELAAFVPPEEVHDHRYAFTSSILKGVLSQEFYSIASDAKGDHVMRYVSCDPEKPAPDKRENVKLTLQNRTHSNRGSQYLISENAFHKVLPVASNTITWLQREKITKEFARAVSPVKEEVCPFSKDLPEDELWAWVKRIIEE